MKQPSTLLVAAAALFMAGCTAPIAKRIERNPEIYNALSARHKAMVQQGKIEEGMTKQGVFIAWGRPDRAAKGTKSGKDFERWSYIRYDAAYGPPYGGFGPGYWGHGWGGGGCYYDRYFFYEPMVTYVPYEGARVEFLNGVVTAWEVSR
jgi:hypothetical protein